jgi:Domain of unknown function (DUF4190)
MTYPPQQQPGSWSDPSWPGPEQPQPVSDPWSAGGYQTTVGHPGAPGYQTAPGYQGYPGYGYPVPAVAPTNSLAIAALVLALCGIGTGITAPIGAILGHVARRQIRQRGEQGDGMALAGIIVGWIVTACWLAAIAIPIILFAVALSASGTTTV